MKLKLFTGWRELLSGMLYGVLWLKYTDIWEDQNSAGLLLGLLFGPENKGSTFLRNAFSEILPTRLHGNTSQKTAVYMVTSERNTNPAFSKICGIQWKLGLRALSKCYIDILMYMVTSGECPCSEI